MSIQSCRVLYLSEFEVQIKDGEYSGKLGPYVEALSKQFTDLDVFTPRLKNAQRYLQGLRSFGPNISRWKTRFMLNIGAFKARSRIIEKYLQQQARPYDLIIQELSLFTPGTHFKDRTYFVMTDNTISISLKYWPDWAPFRSNHEREAWLSAERDLYQNATYLFPVSELVAHSFQHDYGCSPERISSPIGMGCNLLAESIEDKDYGPQIVLFVGLDAEIKGLRNLLNAWKAVQGEHPAAELWLVGVEPLAEYRDVPGIQWLGIVKDRDQMRDIYSRATIYAQPSLFEAFGLSFMEAMGHGIACIGPDGYGAKEFIENGETGFRVPPEDEQQLAQFLKKLLESEALRRRLGHNAYHLVLQEYTWDAIVLKMLPHLEKALKTPCENPIASD